MPFSLPFYDAATQQVYGQEPDLTREGSSPSPLHPRQRPRQDLTPNLSLFACIGGSIPVTLSFADALGVNVLLLPMGRGDDGAHSVRPPPHPPPFLPPSSSPITSPRLSFFVFRVSHRDHRKLTKGLDLTGSGFDARGLDQREARHGQLHPGHAALGRVPLRGGCFCRVRFKACMRLGKGS